MLEGHFIQNTNLLEFLYLTLKLITFFLFFSNGCFLADKTPPLRSPSPFSRLLFCFLLPSEKPQSKTCLRG